MTSFALYDPKNRKTYVTSLNEIVSRIEGDQEIKLTPEDDWFIESHKDHLKLVKINSGYYNGQYYFSNCTFDCYFIVPETGMVTARYKDMKSIPLTEDDVLRGYLWS
jgi:hypothetical protein